MTKDEITNLVKANPNKFLPEGMLFDGYSYINEDGQKLSEHPNLKELIDWYLNEQNAEIGDYNRKIEKDKRAFEKTYY